MSYDYQNCINYAVETAVEAAVKTATEKALADGIAKGLSEGEEKGKNKVRCETARNLLKMGLTAVQIAQATGLSEEEVLKMKSE